VYDSRLGRARGVCDSSRQNDELAGYMQVAGLGMVWGTRKLRLWGRQQQARSEHGVGLGDRRTTSSCGAHKVDRFL
jgi:hypothetical protein